MIRLTFRISKWSALTLEAIASLDAVPIRASQRGLGVGGRVAFLWSLEPPFYIEKNLFVWGWA